MKGIIALCIIGAVVAAGVDVYIIVKYGIDPLRYWPFVWTGVFLTFALMVRAIAKAKRKAVPTTIRTL